ncbi:MAG: PKD domain-containing protein [Bacteroidota bacterium]
MKKILLALLIVVSFFSAKAQWVSIPDTVFGKWLKGSYPACMQGNSSMGWQMDTSCPAVLTETNIDCSNQTINDITGIQYFDDLDSLNCSLNRLTTVPPLPSQLVFFLCYYNKITSLPPLPINLRELGCSQNKLTTLPPLPNSIKWLLCTQNQLTVIPELPDSLYYLWISDNPIICMPRLKRIVDLQYLRDTLITCLPDSGNVTNSVPSLSSLPICDSSNTNHCPYCHAFFSIYPDSINQGVYYGYNLSSGSNLTDYLWEFGDGATSPQQFPSHSYSQPGQYHVCLTVSGADCTNTYCDSSFYVFKTEAGLMSQLNILNPATGIHQSAIDIPQFGIHPNPASTNVTISIDESMLGSTATVTDVTGRKMAAVQLVTSNLQLATDHFANGVYFVTVSNEEERSFTKKLVVSK